MAAADTKLTTSQFQSHLKRSNLAFTRSGLTQAVTTSPKRANFVLLDHFSMSCFSVALDTLVTLNMVYDHPVYECKTYSLQNSKALSDVSIELATDGKLQDMVIDQDSMLIICGGYRSALKAEPILRKQIAKAAQLNNPILGLWNGGFYIADSKIHIGNAMSIHKDNKAIMEEHFPDLSVSTSAFTDAGAILTCSGPNSALDMMLHFISTSYGKDYADAVAEVIGSDRNSSSAKVAQHFLRSELNIPDCVKDSILLMENNLEDLLGIDEIAALVGISRRQIERLFKINVGVTPARYYLELRLNQARQLIQQSSLSIFEISIACGFVSSAHFSRTYHRFFGQAPIDTRRTFRAT
ncbi:GlxA family transcriptional regulator [Marinomonas sp. IMCC 4694]|uniref:GlxA family transcriptional regulator n=1 Tax=Marinomonas sp. IMCC 4694 TaxID=2605432 RepID=UPI0011E65419|nr:helix-turn-helix domain-containing protein [Marinomonas sp. IMCC 4694]TYL48897.1 helix-turn-helix domain-containing protein [Marinomonas sp. IMCC 4694]